MGSKRWRERGDKSILNSEALICNGQNSDDQLESLVIGRIWRWPEFGDGQRLATMIAIDWGCPEISDRDYQWPWPKLETRQVVMASRK
jgi:hypothetical protein